MRIAVRHTVPEYRDFRAAAVRSLFNVDGPADFALDADLPIEGEDWRIGVVVGPSGSGKTSIGRGIFAAGAGAFWSPAWPDDVPIVSAIDPDDPGLERVTGALATVGLGSVPAWLRPYPVLSNGERFRADMARLIIEGPDEAVVDEFTSVVDRQIARIGALAFAKGWRRRPSGRVVLLTPHYDVIEWLEPDWVYDTASADFARRRVRRPRFDLEIRQTGWAWWPLFEPHHYLKVPPMIAAKCYVGTVEGEPVCHVAFSTRPGLVEARACRLVVMPEWQGAGVGLRFLEAVCEMWRRGENMHGKPMPTLFHSSHPGLAAALRRAPRWTQVSAHLHGQNKVRCAASMARSGKGRYGAGTGYGGHFRAVQGFRYLGDEGAAS